MSLGTGVRSFNLVGTNLTTFLAALAFLPLSDLAFALALTRTGFAVLTAIVSLLGMGFKLGDGSYYYYILPVNPLAPKWRMSSTHKIGVTLCFSRDGAGTSPIASAAARCETADKDLFIFRQRDP